MRKVLIVLTAVVSVSLIGVLAVSFITPPGTGTHLNASEIETSKPATSGAIDNTYTPPSKGEENEWGYIENENANNETPFVPATEIDTDITSITVFVNKEYALPEDYVPENMVVPNVLFNLNYYDERKLMRPEAATALEELFAAAKADGYTLYGISAYRSYDRQRRIFLNNIVKKGKNHTLKYSAVPGTSEHQTGLAIDVSTKALGFKLIDAFAKTPEGIWLSKNAHHYGYIIRYPLNKLEVTGYAYEPWHIRYVGKDLATYLYNNDLTLDEYYQYTPSEGFDFEAKYASLINYRPPVVTQAPEDDDPALSDEEALLDGEQVDGENLEDEDNIDEENSSKDNKTEDKDKEKPKNPDKKEDGKEEPEVPNKDDEETKEETEDELEDPITEEENPVDTDPEDLDDLEQDPSNQEENQESTDGLPSDALITPTMIPINEDEIIHPDTDHTEETF